MTSTSLIDQRQWDSFLDQHQHRRSARRGRRAEVDRASTVADVTATYSGTNPVTPHASPQTSTAGSFPDWHQHRRSARRGRRAEVDRASSVADVTATYSGTNPVMPHASPQTSTVASFLDQHQHRRSARRGRRAEVDRGLSVADVTAAYSGATPFTFHVSHTKTPPPRSRPHRWSTAASRRPDSRSPR